MSAFASNSRRRRSASTRRIMVAPPPACTPQVSRSARLPWRYARKSTIPRNLYPGWPVSSTLGRDNVAHAMVQILAQRVCEESQRTSITDVAARCGMTASTVSDIVNGVVWPTVETLARLEIGLEKPLWPRLRQNN
ncbi:TPA: helix-turn-helix transcriptional regulator [Corynebacterium striatum]|nr:helix-turn-helix transcriptional regulator [Corynebacterium striatum]HCG3006054.1 helix-turn-helix transcriptional regulator [Corynebacterium striatum]HCG3008683.1 helix-turn-helix transcriptional regulator [Corynebacterium striatum]HCG3013900.1 helix-turn-helix transcriptional regulator [Corynebacterium striatum]HCG3148608.1 helix-turn-helix transcriptional regulator [Corynebacterium striatum]